MYSVCPPVPSYGYVYNLLTLMSWEGMIVPLCVPEIEGYGFEGAPVLNMFSVVKK